MTTRYTRHLGCEGEACLVSRNDPMHGSVSYLRNNLSDETDILHEYFIPRDRFVQFVNGLREIVRSAPVPLLNASVRVVHREGNVLRYAPSDDMLAVVLDVNQSTDRTGREQMDASTSQVIDLCLRANGRFFLPYQVAYNRERLEQSYPQVREFRAARRVRSGSCADEHIRGKDRSAAWSMKVASGRLRSQSVRVDQDRPRPCRSNHAAFSPAPRDDGIVVVTHGHGSRPRLASHRRDRGRRVRERIETMPPETIDSRVDRLESRVSELEKLPDRLTAIESQIVQLRSEMRNEFSAVREEIRAGDTVLAAKIDETRRHMLVLHEEVIGRLAIIQEGQPRRRRRKET